MHVRTELKPSSSKAINTARVKSLIFAQGYPSVSAFAARVGVSTSYLYNILNHRRRYTRPLPRIATALGVPASRLLTSNYRNHSK